MTFRRFAPLLISALILTAFLLFHFSRTLNWNWTSSDQGGSFSPVLPVDAEAFDSKPTEIFVTVSLEASGFARLSKLNDTFMSKYPRIRVQLNNVFPERNGYDDWLDQSEQGRAPDIMLLDNDKVLPMAVKGHLKSLDSLMAGDVLADQLSGLLEPLRWNGYLWGVPSDIDPYLLFWNKDMLRQLGQQSPISDMSVLEDSAKAFSERPDGDRAFIANFSPGDLHQLLVWEAKFHQGKQPFIRMEGLDDIDKTNLIRLDAHEGLVAQIPLAQSFRLNELVLEDKLLSAVMTWSIYNKLSKLVQDKLTIDAEGIAYPWLNGSSYVIAAGSKFEDEAMIWIQEMTGAANNYSTYEASGDLPVRASLYGEQAQLVFKSGKMPPVWWYEALNAKQPEGETALADPEWPLKWQQRESDWHLYSGEGALRITDFLSTLPGEDQK
ncbi:extracellular solute-binding protein [Paenibacillus sp. LHD-117]|uniref:extracellular solute-binding protein n=1 Tax=Paenibacillus sp. LHD-117 TaxID=3071412 RepID=UPI0027E1881A|nr:extracellular solute-binding protein [Paenibacillus sp. LHD-117]MDQ6418986.1 extracellular solute-binding protein [Paenibacillus sp. LHD-117]